MLASSLRWVLEGGGRPSTKFDLPAKRQNRQHVSQLFLQSLEDRLTPAAGALDSTFGVDGIVTGTLPSSAFAGNSTAMAIQSDGKIVVANNIPYGSLGDPSDTIELERFHTNGTVDTTFGTNGFASIPRPFVIANQLVVLGNGQILVGGDASTGPGPINANTILAFAATRFNANGTLDTTFGTKGLTTTAPSLGVYACDSMVVFPNGEILLGGEGAGGAFGLARYTANGVLDTSFGANGVAVLSAVATGYVSAMALQPDGSIVVVGDGSPGYSLTVARFTASGTLDTSFNNGEGYLQEPDLGGGTGIGVLLQPDGDIVVGGDESGDTMVLRYTPSGALDTTFATGGILDIVGSANTGGPANDLVAQSDGKILIVGYTGAGASPDGLDSLSVARITADGQLDPTFGTNGTTTTDISGNENQAYEGALEPNGELVVAGFSYNGPPNSYYGDPGTTNIVLARFLTADSPPVAAAGGPYTVTYGGPLTLDGSGSTDPDDLPSTYSWIINGQANAATGVSPTLSWAQLQALGIDSAGTTFQVSVQVNDGQGDVVNSSPAEVTVDQGATTTTLTSLASSLFSGQQATFTATVSPSPLGSGTPTGMVTLLDGSTTVDTATLNANGQTTFTTSSLGVGIHNLTAVYSGDSDFEGNTSSAVAETITTLAQAVVPVTVDAETTENTPVSLAITVPPLTDMTGSSTLRLYIDGVPTGAVLNAGTDLGDGTWQLTPNDLIGLAFSPPVGEAGTYTLTVQAVDTKVIPTTSLTNTATGSASLQVTVQPPVVIVPPPVIAAPAIAPQVIVPKAVSVPVGAPEPGSTVADNVDVLTIVNRDNTSTVDNITVTTQTSTKVTTPTPGGGGGAAAVAGVIYGGPSSQQPTVSGTALSLSLADQGSLFTRAEARLPAYLTSAVRHPLPTVLPLDQTLSIGVFSDSSGDSLALIDQLYRNAGADPRTMVLLAPTLLQPAAEIKPLANTLPALTATAAKPSPEDTSPVPLPPSNLPWWLVGVAVAGLAVATQTGPVRRWVRRVVRPITHLFSLQSRTQGPS